MKAALLQRRSMIALLAAGASLAAHSAPARTANACAVHAAEAADRSGLSDDVVMRVMMAESAGNPRIVSPKGAMGCMQIMPRTWAYLTARYNLGADPFDARRNMIGGAMYLAELTVRYGSTGALAAYNAGPGRYERYAGGSRALPSETIAYVRRIGASAGRATVVAAVARWQDAGLFLARDAASSPRPTATGDGPTSARQTAPDPLFPLVRMADAQAAPTAGP